MEIIQSLFLLFSIANIPYDEQANKLISRVKISDLWKCEAFWGWIVL